ncbi:centrosomal protein 15 isoform X1 [Mobula hypostoma]|uniref:centrosomal protein 15 isoform X1 n=2 Tax=Mobula hypostoma TaxID=723540 RepID=UPI002FC3278F
MKMSYLAHEVELSKRHEKILSLRATLLQQMEDQLESQVKEKKLQAIKFESANERNKLLLKDLEAAEKNLRAGVHIQLHPAVIALETKYWASIEEQLPKWEQLFLGQTRNPVEVRNARHKQSQNELLQDKDTIQITNLPSPVSTFKTPPRFPQLWKQKKQTHKT